MSQVVVLVAFQVKPGAMAPFLDILKAHARGTLAEEPGCERFEIMTPRDGSNTVHLHEVYRDAAAYAEHAASARLAAVRDSYQHLIEGRTLTVCDMVD